MAAQFFTNNPQALLDKFDAAISQREPRGKIETWEKSGDGEYYTHKAREWAKKAWFRPAVKPGALVFNIIKPQNANVTKLVYAYYHGHLIETFLNHFDREFQNGSATALPTVDDHCG